MMGALLSEYIGASETVRCKAGHSTPVHSPESSDPGRLVVIVPGARSTLSKSSCKPIKKFTPPHNAAKSSWPYELYHDAPESALRLRRRIGMIANTTTSRGPSHVSER
jgi:hypothetical protein